MMSTSSSYDLSEALQKSYSSALKKILEMIWPYIVSAIGLLILYAVIRYIGVFFIRWWCVMIGDSKRETRRKLRIWRKLIDIVSNLPDILKLFQHK